MSATDLHVFWHRTTAALQQTLMRATCTDATAQSGHEYATSLSARREAHPIVSPTTAALG